MVVGYHPQFLTALRLKSERQGVVLTQETDRANLGVTRFIVCCQLFDVCIELETI